jgi:arylsulfatase A-like enzyme
VSLRRLFALIPLLSVALAAAADKPHIVYILADDLGWKDVAYHGGKIKTPHLDRLASEGLRLEKFYVQPYSTQTRAALMTGRYPMRYGLQTLSIQPWSQYSLPVDERLLPQALKEAGYQTALIGKWHLGHAKKEWWPLHRGFEYFYGYLHGDVDHLKKTNRLGEPDWHRNDQALKEAGFDLTLLSQDASKLIAKHDSAKPLFLMLALPAPIAPYTAPKELLDRHRDIADETRRGYAALVSALDDTVGAVVASLEQRGMLANTLIVFHSSAGGALPTRYPSGDGDVKKAAADNGPYAEGKGSFREGGVRVVALAYWKERIQAGHSTEMMHVTDLYPTLLAAAGAKISQPKPMDGLDQSATLAEGKPSPRKEVLVNMEDSRAALIMGMWKLIVFAGLPQKIELFNLHDDPAEENNKAEAEPERVRDMMKRLTDYAWEMTPSKYIEELHKARKHDAPMFWGENPIRP